MIEKLLRTFLAVPVPDEVRSKKNMLYSTLEGSPAKINWVKNIHLHLTLKFLGYTPELSNSEVINHIETITRDVNPFNLTIEETGCLPIPERPRVLWMGVTGDLKPLLNLVSRIERSLDGLGFPKERQVYSPHITLARVKYPQKWTPDVGLFLKSSYDPIDFPVDRVQFISSELLPTGAVYTLLNSFPLGETV
jgi:2'-5' RNA ligase